MSALAPSMRPSRPLLRGTVVGIAAGLTAGTLYAAMTPDLALGHGAMIGIAAGAVAGLLRALVDAH